jgi:archaellum component FlaG (FlaF/FlaG flagellin family)
MKVALIVLLAASPCAFAQEGPNVMYQSQAAVPGPVTIGVAGAMIKGQSDPVQGAPYSATITNESVQTLVDGNRIVQNTTGMIARDSQGRTRHDATLPSIGSLSAADGAHLVFIQDPVAKTSYTLNLTEKTAQKMPMPTLSKDVPREAGPGQIFMQAGTIAATGPGEAGVTMTTAAPPMMTVHRMQIQDDPSHVTTEDLGTQSMEGILVTGVRATRTIPAGEMGNEKPIVIVTEVWTSPDLKTIISSKRSDPRMGDQTFRLTNLVRAEPDASLFSIPADFKIVDGPRQHVLYRTNP